MHIISHFNNIFTMLPECVWYCRDTYTTNITINLQIINNEIIIFICLILRYMMLHYFISSRKLKSCVKYLRMLSRFNAADILYFQYSFLEIRIIKLYCIIHGSVVIHMCSNRYYSEVYEAYFRFSVGCELGEQYVHTCM